MLQNVPQSDRDWEVWSFANYDALNQIRAAILAQKNIQLSQYQVEPIVWADIDTWMDNNQQAHTDFNGVLGLNGSDLLHADLKDKAERESWVWLNFMELQAACQTLKIGP